MELFHFISNYFQLYPRGTLLFFVAVFNFIWVFNIVFIKQNFQKPLYKAYFFYSFFILLWVFSNAYFQLPSLMFFGQEAAKLMGLAANVFSLFAIICFFYLSCFLRYGKEAIPFWAWFWMFLVALDTIAFNMIPGFQAIEVAHVFENGNFELIFSKWNNYFFPAAILTILMGFLNFFLAIKNKRPSLEDIRFYYIFFGMSLMYGSLLIFTVFLPGLAQNYEFVWIPPFLSIADVLIFGYAIELRSTENAMIHRFSDIKLVLLKLTKAGVSFVFALSITFFIDKALRLLFQNASSNYGDIVALGFLIFFYFQIYQFLHSEKLYRFFGRTNLDYFYQLITKFKNTNTIYTNIGDLETDLKKIFCSKLKVEGLQVLVVNTRFKKKFKNLFSYIEKNKEILVLQELLFVQKEKVKIFSFSHELQQLGEVCLPLISPSKNVIGVLILGNKKTAAIYTKEEIDLIEGLSSYLSLNLTSIFYQQNLQKQVSEKTKKLKKQNAAMKNLLAQQSDFISLTAHELRTPVSVAKASLDILSLEKMTEKMKKKLDATYRAISIIGRHLETFLETQKYDEENMSLHYSDIFIKDFAQNLKTEFETIMKQKKIRFSVKNTVKNPLSLHIDTLRLNQVFRNIIINAKNFTPEKGKITVFIGEKDKNIIFRIEDTGVGVPDKMKDCIFEKFRGNHTLYSPGIGLGLYISKKILLLHGGAIWVEDTPGGGATFCVKLPLN